MENHGDVNIVAVAYVEISVKSGKFTFEVRSESGKLSTIGCHLPPKSTHFGTLSVANPAGLMFVFIQCAMGNPIGVIIFL